MKRAFVTGAAAGLGLSIGDRLKAEGWEVIGLDRDAGDHVRIRADLSSPDGTDRALKEAAASGPYDLVVLNAGISATGRFEEIDAEAHRRVLAVNAEAAMVLANGLVRASSVLKGGSIVFVSSLSHFVGYPGAASYAASKSAIAIYAQSLRKPLKRRGIAVTLVCPGPLRTGQAARHAPEGAKAEARMAPEIAAAAILSAVSGKRFLVTPGLAARGSMLFGRLAPGLASRAMRRLIYDRLDRPVW
ncbi:SDR family NAD(P)-dependent oxidoreductase [Fulvimarina endophytica]|uniref:SDR family NAD(P)-dependent oxidoreductase n=1 Tax=Fulvimarina endophytica TaxID=2293836 RepID=UPI001FE0672E|nr:SDR family NAD(P)-dependent oxidoreductase [Fulvimarina endophytica]